MRVEFGLKVQVQMVTFTVSNIVHQRHHGLVGKN